jgi:DNA-binding NarL/FixJ family response regulator
MTEITVYVVDDHALVRRGLRAYLETQDDISVVGEAENGAVALDYMSTAAANGTVPDIVLTDLVMPELDGVATIEAIRRLLPSQKIIAVTSFSDVTRINAALQAGASGYLLKESDPDRISAAIRSAFRDQVYLDPHVAGVLAKSMRSPKEAVLSAREREVLALVAEGLTNQEIADRLFISERTARTHVSHIITKLGLPSRIQAALWAIRVGIATAG